jgi:hypothetical protein
VSLCHARCESPSHADTHFCSPNKRTKIPHRNVVLELMKVGEWAGGIVSIPLPTMKRDSYERVAFLQGGLGGPIVAALKL